MPGFQEAASGVISRAPRLLLPVDHFDSFQALPVEHFDSSQAPRRLKWTHFDSSKAPATARSHSKTGNNVIPPGYRV